MFPQRLDSTVAYDIAKAMMDGFNRHYRLFRSESARSKHRFETRDWPAQQRAQRERIEFYDLRVNECVMRLHKEFKADEQPMEVWEQVKLHYIGLLVNHHQPELAETFFNSVCTKILQRAYFQNDFIFVRPAVSTEYIENDERGALPTYRSYYPTHDSMQGEVRRMIEDFDLRVPFDDLGRDARLVLEAMRSPLRSPQAARQLPAAGALGPVLPEQGRLRGRQDHQRLPGSAVRAADPAQRERPAGDRRRAVRRRRPADAVQLRARLLHGRHGGAQRLRAVPAQPDAAQAARRVLQRARPGQAGQDPVLPRLPRAHAPQHRPVPHRARHQGHGHAGVRPAEFSVRVQGHQGLLPAAEGHHARADPRQVPAGETARPRGPHGRHAGVLRSRISARPLHRRADRRDPEVRAQPAGNQRPRRRRHDRGHPQALLHRAAHDPAQHLPAGSL